MLAAWHVCWVLVGLMGGWFLDWCLFGFAGWLW